ncbi:MAG TPA: PhzF family phenazine biosynthesis protein [Fibrobacteraceae bacterium]|nr:PhzF family phenazine biosynthesis protein [Fibrobacteraceae bacterium]
MKYFIVDVFSKNKYSGNQLAVVFLSSSLSEMEMQTIANEFHFSETTFVYPQKNDDGSYRVRIFTPNNEVPFAGHPVLGTAYIIRKELEDNNPHKINLSLNIGIISVTFDDTEKIQWMKQIEPTFGSKYKAKDIAEIIGVTEEEIDIHFPIQEVSTGIHFLLVPLTGLNAIKKSRINLSKYKEFFKGKSETPIFIYCKETYEHENEFNCRMFADALGVPEDPATGSANGCFAAYLSKYEILGTKKVNVKVEQGYEINRKSILHLRTQNESNKYNIEVGGKVIKVAEGHLE